MKKIILYGSKYGSTRRYAEKLSEQTGVPAINYQKAPNLSDMKIIAYLGGSICRRHPGPDENLAGHFSPGRTEANSCHCRTGRPKRTGKPGEHSSLPTQAVAC